MQQNQALAVSERNERDMSRRISSAVLSTAQPPLQVMTPIARASAAAKRQQASRRIALRSLLFQAVRMRGQNDVIAQIDMMDLAGNAA